MRRHHDKRMGQKMCAHIKIHSIITSWGALPSWGVTSIFVVMFALQHQAPDEASKALVKRRTLDLIERQKAPGEIIRELWTIYHFAKRYGWK